MTKTEIFKFYRCAHCGNIVQVIKAAGVPIICCGEPMQELVPNTVEAAHEKHIPVASQNADILNVEIGSVAHPMLPEHHIEWIYLVTDNGAQRKDLRPGDAPSAAFALNGDKPSAVFAYCNLHGLWKTLL